MSHTRHDPAVIHLQRSELAVPGSQPHMFAKALAGSADCVLLDLEDAVAPSDKEAARRNVIRVLNDLDWRGSGKTVSVRVNGIDTPWFYRDLVDVLEQAGPVRPLASRASERSTLPRPTPPTKCSRRPSRRCAKRSASSTPWSTPRPKGAALARRETGGLKGEGVHTLEMAAKHGLFPIAHYPLLASVDAVIKRPAAARDTLAGYVRAAFSI